MDKYDSLTDAVNDVCLVFQEFEINCLSHYRNRKMVSSINVLSLLINQYFIRCFVDRI